MAKRKPKSVIDLLPYQAESFRRRSGVSVDIWSRQTGKDFTSACAADDDAMAKGRDWFIVSLSQRQADQSHDKCKLVAEALKQAYAISGEITGSDGCEYGDYDAEIKHTFRCQARKLHLPNGGSVTSLPGRNPDTIAGLTGAVIFTEFGLFPKGGYEHWRTIFPLTTRGYPLRVISTPRNKSTKFYELVSKPNQYPQTFVDIYRAVAEGLELKDGDGKPTTIQALRDDYGDEAGWAREYECQFTGDLESLVKWAQLESASRLVADDCPIIEVKNGAGWKAGFLGAHLRRLLAITAGSRIECGWDVARHSDLSVLWVNLFRPGRPRTLAGLVVMAGTQFALQREIVREAMRAGQSVGCGDSTGLGMDSNETLATQFPGRWVGVNFSGKAKRELGSILMTAFDDGGQELPVMTAGTKFIACDLYAVQKEGDRENLVLTETNNPLRHESHCDIAYAAALALKAAQTPSATVRIWAA